VLVVGRGSLPAAITTVLRRAGASAACAPEDVVEGADADVALTVLTGTHALDPAAGEPWRRQGTPVLPVVLHPTQVVVGPVLGPGGPCLRCLDLTRADLDPSWPMLLGQLAAPAVGGGPDVSGETSLVWLGASMAAMAALAVVDRRSVPRGRSLEVGLPWPCVRQREWRQHPRCRCGSADAPGRPSDEHRPDQDRMAG
jgi:hypothetical protein